jgi:hypothetical protein
MLFGSVVTPCRYSIKAMLIQEAVSFTRSLGRYETKRTATLNTLRSHLTFTEMPTLYLSGLFPSEFSSFHSRLPRRVNESAERIGSSCYLGSTTYASLLLAAIAYALELPSAAKDYMYLYLDYM